MLNHLCLFLCPKTKKGLETVTRGSTIKSPENAYIYAFSGLFLYYFTIKQNPYETPYTPPKCVKSV